MYSNRHCGSFLVKNPYFDRKLIGKIIYKANVTLEGTALFCPLLRSAPDVEACNTTLQFAKNKGNGDFKNVFGKSKINSCTFVYLTFLSLFYLQYVICDLNKPIESGDEIKRFPYLNTFFVFSILKIFISPLRRVGDYSILLCVRAFVINSSRFLCHYLSQMLEILFVWVCHTAGVIFVPTAWTSSSC